MSVVKTRMLNKNAGLKNLHFNSYSQQIKCKIKLSVSLNINLDDQLFKSSRLIALSSLHSKHLGT